jgi:hypothetical protein
MAPFWILCVCLVVIVLVGVSGSQRRRSGPTVSELLGLDLLLSEDDLDLAREWGSPLAPATARGPAPGAAPGRRQAASGPGRPARSAAPRRGAPVPPTGGGGRAGRGRGVPAERPAGRRSAEAATASGRSAGRPVPRRGAAADRWRAVRLQAVQLANAGRYQDARRVIAPFVGVVPEASKLDRAWRAAA